MKYPTIRTLFDRKKKSCDTRKGIIEIEISFERKRKWISTGVSVLPSQWNAQSGVVRHPDSVALNMRIDAVRKPINDYISTLMIDQKPFTFDGLASVLVKAKNSGSFVEYVEKKIESRKDLKEITRRNHRRLNNALAAFRKIQAFDDLTTAKIREFDEWLHEQKYTQTTVAVYHKFMKNYIHLAMADELVAADPYAGIRIDKGKYKQRKYLTDEELDKLRKFSTADVPIMRARDLFLFQCFTGLAYVDLMKFDFTTAIQRNGKYVVRDIRQKSEEEYYIVLMAPAVEILEKYGYELPKISNQKYNVALKAVAAGAGIKFSLTSHCGRHTFATYCLNHGVSIETLAPMMGHSDIKTTQIYARMVNKTIESAFEGLEESLKNKIKSGPR